MGSVPVNGKRPNTLEPSISLTEVLICALSWGSLGAGRIQWQESVSVIPISTTSVFVKA